MTEKAIAGNRTNTDMATERHYTEQEIAEMWHLHRKTVHKLFYGQPGVLEFGTEEGRFKRPRRSRRIPESVMLRVYRQEDLIPTAYFLYVFVRWVSIMSTLVALIAT